MGVAGAGKSTVGRQLAASLHWGFCDGDLLHPQQNIEKIRQGLPLNDDDRLPWLTQIRKTVAEWIAREQQAVLAASLLKQAYRRFVLDEHPQEVELVYLKASASLLQQRLRNRTGHFMGETLLASQLDILEEPAGALIVDASLSPDVIVTQIRGTLAI